jgi:hypothetical protein
MQKIQTQCPVVEVTSEKFVEFVNVGGERQVMEFTREVSWVQESSTELLFVHGNLVIKKGPEYSDYYGYMKSLQLEDARRFADEYSITDQSSLKLIAKTKIIKRAYLETEEDKAVNLGRGVRSAFTYSSIPEKWFQRGPEIDEIPSLIHGRELNQVLVYEDVWSSHNSDEENQKIIEAFKQHWAR